MAQAPAGVNPAEIGVDDMVHAGNQEVPANLPPQDANAVSLLLPSPLSFILLKFIIKSC